MAKAILCCVSIAAFIAAAAAAWSGEQAPDQHVLRAAVARSKPVKEDCEGRMRKLDASDAEGQERLDEKNAVIDYCSSQYKRDKTIERLVDECAKYEEQPVVKQQAVAECQLAAYNYANILYALKAEYRK